MDTDNWFMSNEFFFSLDQFEDILNVCLEFLTLLTSLLNLKWINIGWLEND